MSQIKILAIGNSFSQDATQFLHDIAKADGVDTKVVNLYIGGCSLQRHWENIESNAKNYLYERDGKSTGNYITIQEALVEEDWDYIVTQQASHDSGMLETYSPYLERLFEYIRRISPDATCFLQQTWAYEKDSNHDCFPRYHSNQSEMYIKLRDAYKQASVLVNAELIPCGDAIQKVRTIAPFIYEEGGMSLCRDGFHMHYLYGRYLLAATWYEKIFKKSILENNYLPKTDCLPEEEVNHKFLEDIKKCIHQVVTKG